VITTHRIARWAFWGWLIAFAAQIALAVSEVDPPRLLSWLSSVLFWGIFAPVLYDWSRSRTATEDRALFLMELADLIRLSIPVDEALAKLSAVRKRAYTHRFAQFSATVAEISERASQGSPLAVAFREVQGVPAHWGAYTLYSENPEHLASLLEELAKAERSNLRLPFLSALRIQLLVPLYIGVLIFLTTYILPTFVELFKGLSVELPWSTRLLIALSEGLATFHVGAILVVVCTLILMAIPFESLRHRLYRVMFFLPGASSLIKLDCQRQIYRIVGAGLEHGVPQSEALLSAGLSVSIPAYQKALRHLDGQSGNSLSQTLAKTPQLFSETFLWLIKQGESLEDLPEALITAAEVANVELDQRCRKMATNLDTFVLVTIGVFVGFAVISVFLPIYIVTGLLG
jgi:type II secretory pathway component PulF